jgi:hypothetical protein
LEGFSLLSRRYLAAAVLAGGLAATAVVPAVAAAATPEPTPPPGPVKVIKTPNGLACVVTANGQVVIKPTTAVQAAEAAKQAECRKAMAGQVALPFPKGAPQTGGGGMAAEVSSWG